MGTAADGMHAVLLQRLNTCEHDVPISCCVYVPAPFTNRQAHSWCEPSVQLPSDSLEVSTALPSDIQFPNLYTKIHTGSSTHTGYQTQ